MVSSQVSKSPYPPKVLVVDDESSNLFTFQRALRAQFDVVMASKADEALRLIAQSSFDVLVLDFAMPEMNGQQLLQKARLIDPDLPCIFITAYAELDSVRRAARNNGVVKLLMKPWDKETLTRWLNHCASMSRMKKSVGRMHPQRGTSSERDSES